MGGGGLCTAHTSVASAGVVLGAVWQHLFVVSVRQVRGPPQLAWRSGPAVLLYCLQSLPQSSNTSEASAALLLVAVVCC